jgi:hypothetical protein
MGLIKEPRDVDFTVKSEPWTEEELADFRKLMKEIKSKKNKLRLPLTKSIRKKDLV